MPERRGGLVQAERGGDDRGHQHGGAQLVDAGERTGPAAGDAVTEDHVEHEAGAVGEREREAERLAGQVDVGEHGDAADGERKRDQVARGAGAGRGEHDRAEELDRADRGERQPVDGQVEQRVHGGEHGAEREQHPPPVRRGVAKHPPRSAPEREHHGRGGDPQPGHAEHLDVREQQHRQRRAEVVEDRAGEEERARRQQRDGAGHSPGRYGHLAYRPRREGVRPWPINGRTARFPVMCR